MCVQFKISSCFSVRVHLCWRKKCFWLLGQCARGSLKVWKVGSLCCRGNMCASTHTCSLSCDTRCMGWKPAKTGRRVQGKETRAQGHVMRAEYLWRKNRCCHNPGCESRHMLLNQCFRTGWVKGLKAQYEKVDSKENCGCSTMFNDAR